MNVFLSASVPDPRRDPVYLRGTDTVAIRVAVRALAVKIFALPGGRLIFGGHPAISPLVLLIARALGALDRVDIYQSEWFRQRIPKDNLAFSQFHWVAACHSAETSLLAMREEMLCSRPFVASFFVGGMKGVLNEWELLLGSSIPMHPVASTGGAALMLFERYPQQIDPRFRVDLEHNPVYGRLFRRILFPA